MDVRAKEFTRLQSVLGHTFQNPDLLKQALTHRSFAARNNERLEFVGDAILDYTVARMLFDTYPKRSEGELSRLRSNLVNQTVLAQIAQELGLGDALYLGQGELKSGGHSRPSILADALEAIFAAVSLDADFATAEAVVRRLFAERVKTATLGQGAKDPKSALQEALQAQRLAVPKYRIISQSGEAHEQQFEVACDLGELGFIATAHGSSRRAAEQEAATLALAWFEAHASRKKKS